MSVQGVLAQATVRDLTRAEAWYETVFGAPPGARPMNGLLEWHFGAGFGVQVWAEPDRAGHSTVVLSETDLDGLSARLTRAGIEHPGPQPGGGQRVLQVFDPDGNRLVFTGA
ncbi:VOC family protein [Kineosporia succinea]|uniref:Catechol 2,3-dioxygenase-like lactoylglutathione lyase family enzyme n=1 Tax=Kineosporia succinea TaxID=84632 RepID=A0ABT9PAS3_9ACTN|nr:VOC family protein [Kineosporia succinea]MDP9829514.1 catechol 2,3-dioxygenase-like lactoylglutathione lyase family enzyme [Kineosporia succinea]